MKSADDFFGDIEQFRNPAEMKQFFEEKNKAINNDNDYIELARLKKGLFKKFIEEFYLLYCFSQSKYCDPRFKMKIVLGNQGYDAICYDPEHPEITIKLEFTGQLDGKADYDAAKLINKRGYSDVRFNDHKDLRTRSLHFLSNTIKNAKEKSKKDYKGVSLLFAVNAYMYFEVYNNSSDEFVQRLIKELKSIRFTADSIYLLIFNGNSITEINNNIYHWNLK
jgi:hypothetical protein